MLRVALVTEGDPNQMSGGYLYHRRIVALAGEHDAEVRFVSVPARRFPLAIVDGRRVMRSATAGSDVVVVDSLASNTLGPLLAMGLGRRVPIVGSVHQPLGGMDLGRARTTVQARFDRMAWNASTHLVVASELLAEQLTATGLTRDTMTIVPPGRDVTPAGTPNGPSTGDLRRGRSIALLCVGNWVARKGIVELLDAVARLPERSVTLHLVGHEAFAPEYHRRVLDRLDRDDLADRVVRHGIVDPEEMAGLYAAADVFVLASTQEPYGTVYGEAMAAGLPVVGWAAGNLPHLATDGVEGRLLATGDVGALAAALAELADDPALRTRLGASATTRAASLPTWAETAAQFVAVCRAAADAVR